MGSEVRRGNTNPSLDDSNKPLNQKSLSDCLCRILVPTVEVKSMNESDLIKSNLNTDAGSSLR